MLISRFFSPSTFIPINIYYRLSNVNKVAALSIDRNIPLFIKQHLILEKDSQTIIKQLKKLQNHVYRLDKYGESNWAISDIKVMKKWNRIRNYLIKIGFALDKTTSLLEKMHQYMNVEINIRAGVLPTEIKIDNYYILKICDVELQRNIIRKKSSINREKEYYLVWEVYDLLSEIMDDIEDLEEDTKDYNCNRMILSVELKGEQFTKDEYFGYVKRLEEIFFANIQLLQKESQRIEILEIFTLKRNIYLEKLKNLDISIYKSKHLLELNDNNTYTSSLLGSLFFSPILHANFELPFIDVYSAAGLIKAC